MKILIGVDDSEQSKRAVQTVRTLPWPAGTVVYVASVVRPILTAYPEVYAVMTRELMDAEDQLRAQQRGWADQVAGELKQAGLQTEVRVPDGDPRSQLVELAKKEHVDLVVVGSHGRTGFSKLVLGSVASHVVTHAPCSVLVVKQPAA
jgi:nucleotide-binding universal stress UspA family protein